MSNTADNESVIADSFIHKFNTGVRDQIRNENHRYDWIENPQLKVNSRNIIREIFRLSDLQLDLSNQIKLLQHFVSTFIEANLYDLANECLELIITKCASMNSVTDEKYESSIIHINTFLKIISINYENIIQLKNYHIAPMVVSKILICLKDLRNSLDLIFDLNNSRQQEQLAWLVLNICKLIYNIAQPLVWMNCGRYIADTLIYASISIESIINLCSYRHLPFRMKLYSTAYYALLTQGSTVDTAASVLYHAINQLQELRDREELDPPIPPRVISMITECSMDLSIMKCVLSFWKDPDSFSLSTTALAKFNPTPELPENILETTKTKVESKSFAERCLVECIRTQQLTCGNANEPWRKRSSAILKAFWTYYEQRQSDGSTPPEASSFTTGVLNLSIQCLLEVAILTLFESPEGVPNSEILHNIWDLIPNYSSLSVHDEDAKKELSLLKLLHSIMENKDNKDDSNKCLELSFTLVTEVTDMLYHSYGAKRQAMLRRIAIALWKNFIYPKLQDALSSMNPSTTLTLFETITPSLEISFKVFQATFLEDPVLVTSLAILTGTVLKHGGYYRSAIATLKQGLDSLEDYRAARVDVALHLPDDARDISALQRMSFSTRLEAQDWFHSVKRLGAHAFAGYGIFGAGSSADASDQACADLHCDLLSLYFRTEIEYSIQQQLMEEQKVQQTKPSEPVKHTSDTLKVHTHMNLSSVDETSRRHLAKAAKLSCIHALKAYCGKNSYARAVLSLEMAKVEMHIRERKEYLENAASFIEEAEAREQMLKDSFEDLTLMSSNNKTPRHPIVLARSHKFIYVAPVGIQDSNKKGNLISPHFYKVLAKEQGAGTEISLINGHYPGCEKRIPVGDMYTSSPANCAVKIENLRPGERYVFGSVGVNVDDEIVGSLSPSSPSVEALNPLPTVALWTHLSATAYAMDMPTIGHLAGNRVCDRYFMKPPVPNTTTIGKSLNLFLHQEPVVCMMAIQQSSPYIIMHFIRSFLLIEAAPAKSVVISTSTTAHFDLKYERQVHLLRVIRRAAVVSAIASYIQNQELIVKLVCLGYNHSLELLAFDELQMSSYLEGPFLNFLVALQSIPKRHWLDLEHSLYCCLLNHIVKIGIANNNITPVLTILNNLYIESENISSLEKSKPSTNVSMHYIALASSVELCCNLSNTETFQKHITSLFTAVATTDTATTAISTDINTASTVGYLWSQPEAVRMKMVKGFGNQLLNTSTMNAEAKKLDVFLRELPLSISDLLQTISSLMKEMIRGGNGKDASKVLKQVPIFDKFLSIAAQKAMEEWGLTFIQPLPPPAAVIAAPTPAVKGGAKGAAPATAAPPVVTSEPSINDVKQVPDRFENVSLKEEYSQLKSLAEISFLFATSSFHDAKKRNYFPDQVDGPLIIFDPHEGSSALLLEENIDTSGDSTATANETTEIDLDISKVGHVKYLCASISLFAQLDCPYSAMTSLVSLWNFIIDEWITPKAFAVDYKSIRKSVHGTIFSLVQMLESITNLFAIDDSDDVHHDNDATTQAVSPSPNEITANDKWNAVKTKENVPNKSLIEMMYTARNALVFFIQLLWLYKDYEDVVDIGSRILNLYMAKSPEFCKRFGDICTPLLINAQENLISVARVSLSESQMSLETFIFNYEEIQKKKRKKKLRIARLEKDDEELKFEADKEQLQGVIDNASLILRSREIKFAALESLANKFQTFYTSAIQFMDKVKTISKILLKDCRSYLDGKSMESNDYTLCFADGDLLDRFESSMTQYSHLADFLRSRKDKVSLLEAYKEHGDLLLLFHKNKDARTVWHDAIDSFCNNIDACNNWQTCCDKVLKDLDSKLLACIPQVIVILGKLSKFCVARDLDAKAGYCRMAASLCRMMFHESCCHPQSLFGFSTYICLDLCGVAALTLNNEKINPIGLVTALEEILMTLKFEDCFLEALPVVCLLEHFTGSYLRSPSHWMSARLSRIQCLIHARLFAEAASMIAGIKPSITCIINHTLQFPLQRSSVDSFTNIPAMTTPLNATAYDTRATGLDFYGLNPYYNHLPPDHADNKLALIWIGDFPKEFSVFAAGMTIEVPLSHISPEEKFKLEEIAAAAAAAALEAENKLNKGKKVTAPPKKGGATPAAADEVTTPLAPPVKSMRQLLDINLEREVAISCAHYLLEISMSDTKQSNPNALQLRQLSDQADVMLTGVLDALSSQSTLLLISIAEDGKYMTLFSRCQQLKCKILLQRLKLRECRSVLFNILRTLQQDALKKNVSYLVQCEMTQLWFAVKCNLIKIAGRQSRSQDAIALATQAAREASAVFCGYWLRMFLLKRACLNLKLGNIADCEFDCNAIIRQYESVVSREDWRLVRCLMLKASTIRIQALVSPWKTALPTLLQAIELTRKARNISEKLCRLGGFRGADANLTFSCNLTMISEHHLLPLALHDLTEIHDNDPVLTIKANVEPRKLNEVKGGISSSIVTSTNEVVKKLTYDDVIAQQKLRYGPIDDTVNVYSPSCFANIYSKEAHTLVACHAALCNLLDEMRCSNIFSASETFEFDDIIISRNDIQKEQLSSAENGLKVLRYALFASSDVRVTLLMHSGKSRLANIENQKSVDADIFLKPLQVALDIAIKTTHPWDIMKAICIQLIESYGDQTISMKKMDQGMRLKMAVQFLLMAIKLSNQSNLVNRYSLNLTSDKVFTTITDEISNILNQCSSSSATIPADSGNSAASSDVQSASAKGAKPPAKGAAANANAVVNGPTGRDALFLFSSFMRELDSLRFDGFERNLCCDLHHLFKRAYPPYTTQCTFTGLPDPAAVLPVPLGSVSVLWSPVQCPKEQVTTEVEGHNKSLYSHVTTYFLLGAKEIPPPVVVAPTGKGAAGKPAANAAPVIASAMSSPPPEPVLTKLTLHRPAVIYVEKRLRDIRALLIDAIDRKATDDIARCAKDYAEVMEHVVELLKKGFIDGLDESVHAMMVNDSSTAVINHHTHGHAHEGSSSPRLLRLEVDDLTDLANAHISIPIDTEGEGHTAVLCKAPMQDKFMLHLADALSCNKDSDTIANNQLCLFVRSILGYGE